MFMLILLDLFTLIPLITTEKSIFMITQGIRVMFENYVHEGKEDGFKACYFPEGNSKTQREVDGLPTPHNWLSSWPGTQTLQLRNPVFFPL